MWDCRGFLPHGVQKPEIKKKKKERHNEPSIRHTFKGTSRPLSYLANYVNPAPIPSAEQPDR